MVLILEINRIYHMDCIAGMSFIPDGKIDMILSDLPYGFTDCSWDTLLPMKDLWQQYERIIKPNGAIVLTASQPFTTTLIQSKGRIISRNVHLTLQGSAAAPENVTAKEPRKKAKAPPMGGAWMID